MQSFLKPTFLLILLLVSSFAQSAKLYKYQDENGKWHFTDKKPQSTSDVEEIRIQATNEKSLFKQVWVREDTGTNPKLTVVNNYHGPILATLTAKCKKCTLSPQNEVSLLIEGDSEALAFSLIPSSRNWSADYEISVSLGDPNATHDPTAAYGLPVPMDKYFLVTQGFNGLFSHQDEYNKYAIDFDMPIGTPVLAARDGTVMAIEQGYRTAGAQQDFADKANVIYILHDDGTLAVYAHLDMHSANVKLGDYVERGEQIARSGNTGFSTGPHLHFNVQKNFADGEKSIPIKFDQGKGKTFVPIAGQELKWDIYSVVDARVTPQNKPLYDYTIAAMKRAEKHESQTESDDSKFSGFIKEAKNFLDGMLKD